MSEAEAEEIRLLVEARIDAVRDGDYFGVLGLEQTAHASHVQQAYFKLAKQIHPDKISLYGLASLHDPAMAVFQFATQAKDVLSNRAERAKYMRGDLRPVVPGGLGERGVKASNSEEIAKISFHKGSVMLGKRAYDEAESLLRQAVVANPASQKYWTSLGWAIFQNAERREDAERLKEARSAWEKSIELDSDNAQVHYYMALYWKTKGDMDRCENSLQTTIALDANHVDAKRELRLMKMRSGKAPKTRKSTSPGLFARLLTRKKPR